MLWSCDQILWLRLFFPLAEYSGNLPFQAPENLADVTRACLCLYCVLSEWWCCSWALGASVQLTNRLQQLVTLRISSTNQWTVEPGLICIKRYACISPEKVSDLVLFHANKVLLSSAVLKYYQGSGITLLKMDSWRRNCFCKQYLKCVWYFGALCVFQLLSNIFHTVAVFGDSSSIATSSGRMYLSTSH